MPRYSRATAARSVARAVRLVVLLALGVGCAPRALPPGSAADGRRAADAAPGLVGAWRLVETAVRAPGAAWDGRPAPQGGLFVFSPRHYSYFYVRGAEPRLLFADANRPTEAEKAATFETFIAGAGSYTFDGRVAVLNADYRKNPNEMNGAAWRWDADVSADTIRFIFANPPFLPGRDWRLTLVRVE